MLKRNRSLAIVMAVCLCLALMAPVFVAPPAAQAATTYQALSVPTLEADTSGQSLGIIQVDIGNCAAITDGEVLTLAFPSGIKLGGESIVPVNPLPGAIAPTKIVVPENIGNVTNALAPEDIKATLTQDKTTVDIKFVEAPQSPDAGRLLIYFTGVEIGSDDITCNILGSANFPAGEVLVAKVTSAVGCVSTVKSVSTFGAGGLAETGLIIISEVAPGGLVKSDADNTLELELPSGFIWGEGQGQWAWGFAKQNGAAPDIHVDREDARILEIVIPQILATNSTTGAGQIRLTGSIIVDDSVEEPAKEGAVIAHLSDTNGLVSEADLEIGKYAYYGVQVEEGTTTELIAGKHDQKLGTFYISENVANSVMRNRSVKFILPAKVKWSGAYKANGLPTVKQKSGNVRLGKFSCFYPYDTLKATIGEGTSKSKWEFKDLKVDIAPDFSGDITIKIAGDAGITGEVLVATVKPAMELSSEGATKVVVGRQEQELGTLILKETKKGNVVLNSSEINTWNGVFVPKREGRIALTLPSGASWGENFLPTVEVTEGDLVLKTDEVAKINDRLLSIPVKSVSTEPSAIKISGMKVTLDRTVPEGVFTVGVAGNAINETGGPDRAFPQFEANQVAVATCVTPAPTEAATAQFNIGSNIYQINGVSKVMDVSPYIKGDRTYVPVRYLGYALGVAEDDVFWDEVTQKVTLTKGDNIVEMTIGSATIIVNGEAQTMDVAPEIANDRTMLPARYVAEGFDYVVGWDPGSRTVLISK